jgi:hypothetical protein
VPGAVPPSVHGGLFEDPGAACLLGNSPQSLDLLESLIGEVARVGQPQVLGALEGVVALALEPAVLLAPDLIDGFA